MFPITILNGDEVSGILTMKMAIDAVENAYRLKSQGEAALFPVVSHEFTPGISDMDIKSGDLTGAGIFGLKLVSWFSQNPAQHLPPLIGTIMLFDSHTGLPIGIMNATAITGMRTGAASAIGSKYLGRKNSRTLLMVGAGGQAPYQILAHLESFDRIDTVFICDPLSFDRAKSASLSLPLQIKEMISTAYGDSPYARTLAEKASVAFVPVENLQQAVGNADLIATATPSKSPLIQSDWVTAGTHLSCIGADMVGKQEVDERLLANARVFADDLNQCVALGECETAIKKGIIKREDICGEIGEVILGSKKGRSAPDDITLFDSTGIALQDLITAKSILDIAKERNVGTTVSL